MQGLTCLDYMKARLMQYIFQRRQSFLTPTEGLFL